MSPTIKQRKAYKEVLKGSTITSAMVKSGYSETTASTTGKLTNTKGWKELLDKTISDRKLVKVLDEGLISGKRVFKNNNETGEIEDMGVEPDYAVRHKYLETGLKLKSKFPKEDPDNPLDGDLKVLLVQINNVNNSKG